MNRGLFYKGACLALSALIILIAIYIRLSFLETPLERDEGEYAYIGQLLLKGLLPYEDAVNLKFPGIFFIYATALLLLPPTASGIHTALLFTNLITALLLFLIARRLFKRLTAVVTATSFLIMTLSPSIHGLWGNSEHFIMLFVTGALFLIVKERGSLQTSFFAGLLMGLATLTKQHALLFLLFGALSLGYREISSPSRRQLIRVMLSFFAGAALPIMATTLWLLSTGNLDHFLFWTLKYAFQYATETRIDPETYRILYRFLISAPAPLLLALVGVAGILIQGGRNRGYLLLLFFATSTLAMCPGLLFRPHYYLLLVPSLSLLIGAGIDSLLKYEAIRKRETLLLFISLCAISSPLFFNRNTLFSLTPYELSRQTYGGNPFPESLTAASYLKKRTAPEDKIAIIGSEPQIYFYADRVAATKYILTYPLMESHEFAAGMQREMIEELEESEPEYIVFVNVATSWLRQENSHTALFDWFPPYINSGYTLDALIEIIPGEKSRFIEGARVARHRPRSGNIIQIFKRRGAPR